MIQRSKRLQALITAQPGRENPLEASFLQKCSQNEEEIFQHRDFFLYATLLDIVIIAVHMSAYEFVQNSSHLKGPSIAASILRFVNGFFFVSTCVKFFEHVLVRPWEGFKVSTYVDMEGTTCQGFNEEQEELLKELRNTDNIKRLTLDGALEYAVSVYVGRPLERAQGMWKAVTTVQDSRGSSAAPVNKRN